MNKKNKKKIFLLTFFLILSFSFKREQNLLETPEYFPLLNNVVFQESYLFEFQFQKKIMIGKEKKGNSWFPLEEASYFDLNPRSDPRKYLPKGIPQQKLKETEALFAVLSLANDELWKEIVYLVQLGVNREVIFFDVNTQSFYLKKSYSGKSEELVSSILEGIQSRLFFIESNRFHFFLDAVLLLPEDFKLNWFDTIYAWKPPKLPN